MVRRRRPSNTAVERQRFAEYGFPVNDANLRATKLRTVLTEGAGGGLVLDDGAEARKVAALVARHWLQAERH